MSRYFDRDKMVNDHLMYKKKFKKRGVSKIEHYKTPEFSIIDQGDLDSVDVYEYVWKIGDSYWKLAAAFYNAPEEWWVIAAFNRKPTEAHIEVGETIKIPVNLGDILRLL
tara:strand:+ start:193 stop:522 length:330 start_codon:yes stop_codon:yes gene_type:complete